MKKTYPIEKSIKERRAVFPAMYNGEKISQKELMEILENARWAPTHRMTQPWRFIIFQEDALDKLSTYLGAYYKENTPAEKFSEIKYKKTIKKPLQSACVLAIVLHRDPEERVPEWEEIASVSMAVQNIWLSCHEREIGVYWSSPASALNASVFLNLEKNEKCLGLFYMGRKALDPKTPERKKTESFVRFYNG
jgi:nitroreductase